MKDIIIQEIEFVFLEFIHFRKLRKRLLKAYIKCNKGLYVSGKTKKQLIQIVNEILF